MKKDGLDPKLKNAFNELQNISPRAAQAAARGRANFLEQAAAFRQAIYREIDQRHNRWNNTIFPLFQRKEPLPVLNILFAVVLAMTIFFGGTGATVYAAQDSLPDQALYPVKTWSEDAILSLTGSPQTLLNYLLDFADRRVVEMAGLLSASHSIPERVVTRLQNELDRTLELAAGLDNSQMAQDLEQIRLRAESQLQIMNSLMSGVPESTQPALLQVQARIQEQVQLAAMGQADPQGFRERVQQRQQNQGATGERTPGSGNGPQGPGPQNSTGTPMPTGNSFGPGSGNGSGLGGNQPTGGTQGQYGPGHQTPVRP